MLIFNALDMKHFFNLLCLLCLPILFFGQIRYEISGHGYSTFNILLNKESEATQIQNLGIRVGAAINMWSDVQVGIHYQERQDYATPSLITATRFPGAPEFCANNRLVRTSESVELEALFRLRQSQFSRIHTFWGVGLAYAYSSNIHDGDSTVFSTVVSRRNGSPLELECGFPESPFAGLQVAVILAPGIRARLNHRIHLELESQIRYHPFFRGHVVGGLGANLVYNLY